MNCDKIQEMLPAYQDGELSAENEKAVKIHLEGCEVCREEEQLLSASWEMLGELKSIEPSPDFQSRFWARVRKEETKQNGWRTWLNWQVLRPTAFGLAGVAAIWVIGVTGGLMLFEKNARREATHLNASSVLTSPFPQNSIEQIFMQGRTTDKENHL